MENTYNWDEKGFLIGIAGSTARIASVSSLDSGKLTHASQDGCREFISLLAAICGDGSTLPPALIYKGESGDLQDSWIEDLHMGEQAYFSASPNGWTCDMLGANWVKAVFHRHTKDKAGNRRRLLLVDGHSSHVNLTFLKLCDELKILVLVLPPHTTHRLQPLDVSLFAPLARQYTNELNHLMFSSGGLCSMTKRMFWSLFRAAWAKAFTPSNVESAWRKTGLFPLDPDLVISKIAKKTSPKVEKHLTTPMTARALRNFERLHAKSPQKEQFGRLLRAAHLLQAQNEIANHRIRALETAFQIEKRKRRKGKRLGLLEGEASQPQFWSPGRIHAQIEKRQPRRRNYNYRKRKRKPKSCRPSLQSKRRNYKRFKGLYNVRKGDKSL
jgi:hypothetical protein